MAQEVVKREEYRPPSDGFSRAKIPPRAIRGGIIKQVDGRTSLAGSPFPETRKLIATSVCERGQYFKAKELIDSFLVDEEHPADSIDQLNDNIPEDDWEIGLDGKKRKPWVISKVVYLLDENDGSTFTMLNSTVGFGIAWEELIEAVNLKRVMHQDPRILPVVNISSKPMPTNWGTKMRPYFRVVDWKGLTNSPSLLKSVPEATSAQVIGEPGYDPGNPNDNIDDIPL
jgi:hypothetical protein